MRQIWSEKLSFRLENPTKPHDRQAWAVYKAKALLRKTLRNPANVLAWGMSSVWNLQNLNVSQKQMADTFCYDIMQKITPGNSRLSRNGVVLKKEMVLWMSALAFVNELAPENTYKILMNGVDASCRLSGRSECGRGDR